MFRLVILLVVPAVFGPGTAFAQVSPDSRTAVWGEIFAGGELESYLRLLQVTGDVRPFPWSVRAFGPQEARALAPTGADHPWGERYDLVGDTVGGAVSLVRPAIRGVFNSAFPYGSDDGPLWAGKGMAGSVRAGVAVRYGAFSAVLAPEITASQNADFPLMPIGLTADSAFRDPRYPNSIDHPQRFGDGSYVTADLGQSTVRLDYRGAALGISTANQYWGPARDYPLLLGTNAPGFLHGFLGTTRPAGIWIGSVHARVLWGVLEQSDYSPKEQGDDRRFMTGFVASFLPRGVEGLEIGVSRFYHIEWPEDGLSLGLLGRPFESFLKTNIGSADSRVENQLASIHARWVLAPAGFEIYGEFAREDHNYDLRDLILEPDHDSAYLLGFQRVWKGDTRWWALRGEVVNGERSHLSNVRAQVPLYLHTQLKQGHTQRGQLLGSPAVYGGSGARLTLDRYDESGRLTIYGERTLRSEPRPTTDARTDGANLDVIYSTGAEWLTFQGPVEITAGITGVFNFNRYFRSDVFNLNVRLLLKAAL